MSDSYYALASETYQVNQHEYKRLRAIADAAEDLIGYRGNVREAEMWEKLIKLVLPGEVTKSE